MKQHPGVSSRMLFYYLLKNFSGSFQACSNLFNLKSFELIDWQAGPYPIDL